MTAAQTFIRQNLDDKQRVAWLNANGERLGTVDGQQTWKLADGSRVHRISVMGTACYGSAPPVPATDTDTGEEEKPRRCTLCGCDATGERFGFPVCTYHYDHTEDDPQCPTCAAGVAPEDEPTPDTWECPVCLETGCVHSREPHEGYC